MRFSIPYNWYRAMGIATLFLMLYIVVIGIFGKVDISGLLPIKLATTLQEAWPRMPFFAVDKEPVQGGQGEEVYYTVTTRLFSQAEIARMTAGTNRVTSPAAPKTTASRAR